MQVHGQPLYTVVLLASATQAHVLDFPPDRLYRTGQCFRDALDRLMVDVFDDVFPLRGHPWFFVVFM